MGKSFCRSRSLKNDSGNADSHDAMCPCSFVRKSVFQGEMDRLELLGFPVVAWSFDFSSRDCVTFAGDGLELANRTFQPSAAHVLALAR